MMMLQNNFPHREGSCCVIIKLIWMVIKKYHHNVFTVRLLALSN